MKYGNKSIFANLGLLLAAIIWGGGFVAGKMALTGSNPFAILFWRFGISSTLCFLFFHKRVLKSTKSTVIKAFAISIVQGTALCLQLTGLQYTTSAKQSFLCTAYVALVPFVSWLILKKRPEFKAFIAGILALCGIGLISLNGFEGISIGDAMSLGFALGGAIQIVLIAKFVGSDADPFALTFFQTLGMAVISFLICLVFRKPLAISGSEALLGVGYLAVLNTFVAFALQNVCQKYTSDTMASLIMGLESVFGFVCSVLYYHDVISAKFLFGCILCFGAILINSVKLKKKNALEQTA